MDAGQHRWQRQKKSWFVCLKYKWTQIRPDISWTAVSFLSQPGPITFRHAAFLVENYKMNQLLVCVWIYYYCCVGYLNILKSDWNPISGHIFTLLFQALSFLAGITERHVSFLNSLLAAPSEFLMTLNFTLVVSDLHQDRQQKTLNSLLDQLWKKTKTTDLKDTCINVRWDLVNSSVFVVVHFKGKTAPSQSF